MKVLSHEDETLKNGHGAEIAGIKREYFKSAWTCWKICGGKKD